MIQLRYIDSKMQFIKRMNWRMCGQAKRQDAPLIQTKFSVESHLLPVNCGNANMLVSSCQVQFVNHKLP